MRRQLQGILVRSCVLAIAAVSVVLGPSVAPGQGEYQNLSLGASAGKGYAFDLSYGKRLRDPLGHDSGWDLAVSLWTPEYRIPVTRDNTPATTVDDVGSGAYVEETKDNLIGVGLGARYVSRPVMVGGMFDMVVDTRYDYYRHPADGSRSHLREDMILGGWTGTVSVYVLERVTVNAFYGTRRGVNIGLAWNIVDP
jgi:hypothetical protein